MEVQVLLYPVCVYKSKWCHGPGDSSVTAVRTSDHTHKVLHPHCVHKLTRVERMYSSNTLFNGRGIYSIYYIHVSALDNGHLQVVHEILIKQLY